MKAVAEGGGNGDADGNEDRNEDGIEDGVGEVKKRKKPHKNCRRGQARLFRKRHHLCAQGVGLEAPDNFVRKAGAYTRASYRGDDGVRGTGRGERDRG